MPGKGLLEERIGSRKMDSGRISDAMTLRGKVALITGAAGMGNIAYAVAIRLAQDGADIVVTDIDRDPAYLPPHEQEANWRGLESTADEIRKIGQRCLPIVCDITRPDDVEAMIGHIHDKFGRIDVLVNSARAALSDDRVPLTEVTEDAWDRVLAVNLRGPMTLSKFVARRMIDSGTQGRIINISSGAGTRPSYGAAAYACSKAALNMLTRALALELAEHGILVTAVAPGTVDTGRMSVAEARQAAAEGLPYLEWRARRLAERASDVPLGRVAVPDDIAAVVSFLASEDSRHITGEVVSVSGGK